MTNHHVVENATEITILFSDNKSAIIATEYQSIADHDSAVVRFESELELEVANVSEVAFCKKDNLL